MSVSIRSRVLLLVLAVLLPGIFGVAWLIKDTYAGERQAYERMLQETTRALSLAVDSELLQRAVIARSLSRSRWLDGPGPPTAASLRNFEDQAMRALGGLQGWVELYDAERVLLDTRQPGARPQQAPVRALVDQAGVQPLRLPVAEDGDSAYAALVEPVLREGAVKYNVALMLRSSEMQRIVDAQTHSPGWLGVVLDSEGTVVARHPGGSRFVGRQATPDLRALLKQQDSGQFMSVSLDGKSTAAYFSRASMGWTYVVGMPREQFDGQLPAAVKKVTLGALALLALALAGGLWLARRIVGPVSGLKTAALQLQQGVPVTVRPTGLGECDDVTVALAEAAEAIRRNRADLERQVAEAVERTRLAEQSAAQGQRVAAVGRLTGGVAHDINNLLGVISNSAYLIQRHTAAAELSAPLAATRRAVELGSQLTQHLLRFAGRQSLRPQRILLAQTLPELRELLGSVLGRHVTVTVSVAPDTHAVHLDAGELELALINLAMNARDAMPGGGELRISARNASAEEASAEKASQTASTHGNGYVLISVGDDGQGMEPELAAHAFEPFFTTKSVGQGSGMGLSQVHGFCTQAGGSVSLHSTPGLGTTVLMTLPAAGALPSGAMQGSAGGSVLSAAETGAEPAATAAAATDASDPPATETKAAMPIASASASASASETASASATASAGASATASASTTATATTAAPQASIGGARVLLVEDNEILGDVTAALLMAHGAQVERAADAGQALECIERGGIFDVVLSDIMMPGTMDGLALARRLRHLRPKLPVVLITAFSQAVRDAESEFAVLRKPCPQEELLSALRRAIAGG